MWERDTTGMWVPFGLSGTLAREEAWFVAGHWWDVAGATTAGLRDAWVARTDVAHPTALPQPEVTGADLAEVARAILDPDV